MSNVINLGVSMRKGHVSDLPISLNTSHSMRIHHRFHCRFAKKSSQILWQQFVVLPDEILHSISEVGIVTNFVASPILNSNCAFDNPQHRTGDLELVGLFDLDIRVFGIGGTQNQLTVVMQIFFYNRSAID
jgi:hypothetical protein